MKKEGYYSSGEFAKKAHITKKTIRYYDEHNILKPSYLTEHGARFYTEEDFAHLQQILLLKYLGFSLDDIKEMTINISDPHFMEESLKIQLRLVRDRIEQLQLVENAILETSKAIETKDTVDWSSMLDLVNLSGFEKTLKNQYQNASNISARINLHHIYAANKQGWFPWVFEQCHFTPGMKILELGCGDGSLWIENKDLLPKDIEITLSDISSGMLRDVKRVIGNDKRFHFLEIDAQNIPLQNNYFDLVIANHVLFYCDNIDLVCREVSRILKPKATFICSTYGQNHMKEISQLVEDFDDRIVLSAEKLYDRFGKESGVDYMKKHFKSFSWIAYDDHLLVTEPEALLSYILSCHGNQNQYIVDHYKDFKAFVKKKMGDGFYITKDAGIFMAQK